MKIIQFADKLIPNHTNKKNPNFQRKLLMVLFPRISIKKFTFWFGIIWAALNLWIIISEQFVTEVLDNRGNSIKKECQFLFYGASVTPYIRYQYHYHRILLSIFICSNINQVLLGFYVIWSYGFLFEHYLKWWEIFFTISGATLLGSLVGAFFEFQSIRCAGCCFLASWCGLYGILIWEKLNYNMIIFLVKFFMFVLKSILVLMVSLNEYGDPISTVVGFCLSIGLGIAFIKEISHRFDEEKKFILMRLKIFLIIVYLMLLLMTLVYVTVMYDNKKADYNIKNTYTCDNYYQPDA